MEPFREALAQAFGVSCSHPAALSLAPVPTLCAPFLATLTFQIPVFTIRGLLDALIQGLKEVRGPWFRAGVKARDGWAGNTILAGFGRARIGLESPHLLS